MALDPNIALQVQAPQIQNPLTTYAQVAGIQNAQQQNALTGLAIQQAQRQQGQADALNEAFKAPGAVNADGSLNSASILGGLAQSGAGSAIPGVAKQLTEAQTARLQQQKSALELGSQHASAIGQVLAGVNDQASYDRALQYGRSTFGDSAVASLPAQYDPTVVNQLRAQTQTLQQQLEQQNKLVDQQLAQSQFAETQRHNAATEASTIRGQDMTAETAARQQNLRALEYDPKTGAIINKATGQAIQAVGADGKPLAGTSQQPTEYQSKSAGFSARMLASDKILTDLQGKYNPWAINAKTGLEGIYGIGGVLSSGANNFLSDSNQRAEQAQRDFVNAVLRQESGASISPAEFDNAKKQYFPQPGDSDAVIAQKAANRQIAIQGMTRGAGPAAFQPQVSAPAGQPTPAAQQAAQAAPAIAPDIALAELQRRAASNPNTAARLKAMGY
ncbi:hypothetical protein [Burkholderia gladioli]|uniref:hypothetical protein n=1 Tax=Burkholderia gladioli TaxID=28095 RepID=UPI003D363C4D